MSGDGDPGPTCPLPSADPARIALAHGGGGALTGALIDGLFRPAFANPALDAAHDGAVLDADGTRLAFTTDSYVVRPAFFPGGDIGSLAVTGTVNDLAMCGARPRWLSAGLILEEGFPMADLRRVVASMAAAARDAGVTLVTGDTKVVGRGQGDGVYINTAGIGLIAPGVEVAPSRLRPGDAVLLSGDLGRHGMAVMAAREGLDFAPPIESDCAALHRPVAALLAAGIDIHCLRDPTRGGLAAALVELAGAAGVGVEIDEAAIPVGDAVRGACEVLGFDPLHVACEGRFVAVLPEADAEQALDLLRADPLGADAARIGTVTAEPAGVATLATAIGARRVLDPPSGEMLPRIC